MVVSGGRINSIPIILSQPEVEVLPNSLLWHYEPLCVRRFLPLYLHFPLLPGAHCALRNTADTISWHISVSPLPIRPFSFPTSSFWGAPTHCSRLSSGIGYPYLFYLPPPGQVMNFVSLYQNCFCMSQIVENIRLSSVKQFLFCFVFHFNSFQNLMCIVSLQEGI